MRQKESNLKGKAHEIKKSSSWPAIKKEWQFESQPWSDNINRRHRSFSLRSFVALSYASIPAGYNQKNDEGCWACKLFRGRQDFKHASAGGIYGPGGSDSENSEYIILGFMQDFLHRPEKGIWSV